MHVSRVIRSVELVARHPPRRVQSTADSSRVGRPATHRSARASSSQRYTAKTLTSWCCRGPQRSPFPIRSSDPENQAVVEEETETETPEEKSEEEVPTEAAAEVLDGLEGEVLQMLKDGDFTNSDSGVADVEQLLSSIRDQRTAIESQVHSSEAESEELKAKYLRLNADFDNFRKRAESEREKLRTATKGDVIETLLPLIDNFELARTQIKPENESEEAIVANFMGLYRQMVELFSQLGVEAIDCDQKPFDPEFHDAMLRELNNDLPDGTVMQELRKGFTIKGRLLRPAMVKVSYSDEVLQETELPMEELDSTVELDQGESVEEDSETEESSE